MGESMQTFTRTIIVKIFILVLSAFNIAPAIADQEHFGRLIFLSNKDDYYRDITFDDLGNIYGLKKSQVDIYSKNGKLDKSLNLRLKLSNKKAKPFSRILVTSDGKSLFVREREWYRLTHNGKMIKAAGSDPSNFAVRRADGTYLTEHHNSVYGNDLIRVTERKPYPIFVDKHGNLIKKDDEGITVVTNNKISIVKKINGYFEIAGVDFNGNIFYLQETPWVSERSIFVINKTDSSIGKIKLMPREMFFSSEELEEINLFPSMPYHSDWPPPDIPKLREAVTGDGSLYQWYDPNGIFAKEWVKAGASRVIYKFSSDNQPQKINEKGLRSLIAFYKKRKYKGNIDEYDIKHIIEVTRIADQSSYRLQKEFIRVMRNEIFARHGRMFKSENLKRIFDSCSWYEPNPKYSDNMLNDIEKKNVKFILDYEKKMGWR